MYFTKYVKQQLNRILQLLKDEELYVENIYFFMPNIPTNVLSENG